MNEKFFVFGLAALTLVGCLITLIWYMFFRPSDKFLAEKWAKENGYYLLEFRRPKFSETVPKKARSAGEERSTYVGRLRAKNANGGGGGQHKSGWFIIGSRWNPFATDDVVQWVDE
jgi:hypothetical protein